MINITIPIFIPLDTLIWCSPSFFPSLIVSFHHIAEIIINVKILILIWFWIFFLLIIVVVFDILPHSTTEAIIGHGLLVTI